MWMNVFISKNFETENIARSLNLIPVWNRLWKTMLGLCYYRRFSTLSLDEMGSIMFRCPFTYEQYLYRDYTNFFLPNNGYDFHMELHKVMETWHWGKITTKWFSSWFLHMFKWKWFKTILTLDFVRKEIINILKTYWFTKPSKLCLTKINLKKKYTCSRRRCKWGPSGDVEQVIIKILIKLQ